MAYKLAEMTLFSRVEEGQVIISDRGLYRQVDLYERNGTLFAAVKGGFVRLLGREGTTVPSIKWLAIEGVEYTDEYNGPKSTRPAGIHLKAA